MTFDRWDVVLLPFPFTDLSAQKRRPALIISPASYNKGEEVVVMFVTSNLKSSPKIGDVVLQEWEAAGFPKPSKTRMKFATIDKRLIVKKFAKLTDQDANSIKNELEQFFGLK